MSQDRIKIGNIWYIKDIDQEDNIEIDVIETQGCTVENDYWCYEATKVKGQNGEFYKDISIKSINKRSTTDEEEYWDGNDWIKSILMDNTNTILELKQMGHTPYDIKYLKAFLQYLRDKGWLLE